MDDSQTAVFMLDANNVIRGWMKSSRPTLLARCKEGDLDLYVDWGLAVNVESGDTRTVRVRFDDDAATSEQWDESTDNEALFSPKPAEAMTRLLTARSLRVEFTPFNANPQIAVFDVSGFAAAHKVIGSAGCAAALERAADDAVIPRFVHVRLDELSNKPPHHYHRKTCLAIRVLSSARDAKSG